MCESMSTKCIPIQPPESESISEEMAYGFADKRHVQLPEVDVELELQEAKLADRVGSL